MGTTASRAAVSGQWQDCVVVVRAATSDASEDMEVAPSESKATAETTANRQARASLAKPHKLCNRCLVVFDVLIRTTSLPDSLQTVLLFDALSTRYLHH